MGRDFNLSCMHVCIVYTVYKPVAYATICCWGVTVQIGALRNLYGIR